MTLIIRRARSEELPEVYRLVHDAYVAMGYCAPRADRMFHHYRHLDGPQTTVLVALRDGEVVGTNSWTLDGPAGLHVDVDFHREVQRVRAEGRRLGASWRIATHLTCRGGPKVVLHLIRVTVRGMLEARVETALFSFAARHEEFYRQRLNMTTLARRRVEHDLLGVDAVLMRLDAEDVPVAYRLRDYQPEEIAA